MMLASSLVPDQMRFPVLIVAALLILLFLILPRAGDGNPTLRGLGTTMVLLVAVILTNKSLTDFWAITEIAVLAIAVCWLTVAYLKTRAKG